MFIKYFESNQEHQFNVNNIERIEIIREHAKPVIRIFFLNNRKELKFSSVEKLENWYAENIKHLPV